MYSSRSALQNTLQRKSRRSSFTSTGPRTQQPVTPSNILDQTQLKRSLLTTEDRRRKDYSKYRLKQVGLRDNSEEVAFLHTRPTAQDKYTAVQDTLLRLSSSMNEWNNLASEMKALDSLDIAREALAHNRTAQAVIKKFEASAPNFLLEYSPSRIPAHNKGEV